MPSFLGTPKSQPQALLATPTRRSSDLRPSEDARQLEWKRTRMAEPATVKVWFQSPVKRRITVPAWFGRAQYSTTATLRQFILLNSGERLPEVVTANPCAPGMNSVCW